MSKSIHCYDIPYRFKEALIEHGFIISSDLFNLTPQQLHDVTRLSIDDCQFILNKIEAKVPLQDIDAEALLAQEMGCDGSIFTFSQQLNALLADGFPLGRLIEVAGESGSGKTQLCLQLCINVQVPQVLGGLEGQAIYIDTENAFRPERLREIFEAVEKQLKKSEEYTHGVLEPENVMDNVFFKACKSVQCLKETVFGQLPAFIAKNSKIRLIVIDSIAYLLRYDFEGKKGERDNLLWTMCNFLKELAFKHRICVVLTNHVAYNPKAGKTQSACFDQWGHFFSIRLLMSKVEHNPRIREATLIKSPTKPQLTIQYQIGTRGIEDVCEAEKRLSQSEHYPLD